MILNVTLITGEKIDFTVDKNTCVIGRSAQCDVVIPHEAVSRKHCQIELREGELFVTDLGSTAGVTIDGQKITPNKPVKFQSFLTLSFGAVQSLIVDLPEERTSIGKNPLLATTLQMPDKKNKLPKVSTRPEEKKPATDNKDDSMKKFIFLCVAVVIGFTFFIFREDFLSLLE